MSRFQNEYSTHQAVRSTFWDKIHSTERQSFLTRGYRNAVANVYKKLIPPGSRVLELGCGTGALLHSLRPSYGCGVDFSRIAIEHARELHPHLTFHVQDVHELNLGDQTFDYIIASDLLNDLWDVQTVLGLLNCCSTPRTRIILNSHNNLWRSLLTFGRSLGLLTPNLLQSWFTVRDIENLLEVSGIETLRSSREILMPSEKGFVSGTFNRWLGRLWPFYHLCFANFMVARPIVQPEIKNPTVSVVIAARNEQGHIQELVSRIPEMGGGTEVVFVEGGSSDQTYAEIEKCMADNPNKKIRLFRQSGVGKGDAVRLGFANCEGDILMILDADITVPPEDLPRFFDLMASGRAEFVNGVRLVYPMEDGAMRFANLVGNKFFSAAFTWLLGQNIRDTLCGTKVLWRKDYLRVESNRSYFGDFDPFGDFDLLFGAAKLELKIKEIPIRYRTRYYGETNISRWKHGLLLLRMVVFAARRMKFI